MAKDTRRGDPEPGDGPAVTPAPKRARKPRPAADTVATNGAVLRIAGDPVTVVEDGASFEADRADVERGAVGRLEASTVEVRQGFVGAARADTVSVDRGAIGAVMADRVELSRAYGRSILARQVQLDRAAARVIIATNVEAKQTAVLFLVARRVGGEVRVLFDWRGAIAFGAVAGILFGLITRVRRKRA